MILVSACLGGEKCRFDGKDSSQQIILKLKEKGKTILVCPEVMGGLPIPRLPCEIKNGQGRDVLEGKAKVINIAGADVTEELIRGAYEALKLAKENKIRLAILKSKSASCGVKKIYDGSFKSRLVNGNGVFADLLIKEGIRVLSEEEFFGVDDLFLNAKK